MSWEKYKLHTQEPQRYYKKCSSKVLLWGDKNYKGKIEIVSYDKPEALKSLYRSPGNKKKQLVLCKNYVLQW